MNQQLLLELQTFNPAVFGNFAICYCMRCRRRLYSYKQLEKHRYCNKICKKNEHNHDCMICGRTVISNIKRKSRECWLVCKRCYCSGTQRTIDSHTCVSCRKSLTARPAEICRYYNHTLTHEKNKIYHRNRKRSKENEV